ncbi:putative transmembrane anti-sigma factor [Candidatus Sulfopaludibacter sp. SbA3]|nr:putative transmembrane anti-sigma factor [Candidatus Sulfopaludibacter sp. SbA3]
MSCQNVQELVSSLLDLNTSAGERQNALAHIESCRECSAQYESMVQLRASLGEMARPAMPARLRDELRELASRERIRVIARVSYAKRMRNWASAFQVHCENLMRPFALPVAGSLVSAILLFGMWIPTITAAPENYSSDVSTPIHTSPSLNRSNPVAYGGDVVVQLIIDERGKVADYLVIQGQDSEELRNFILWSTWTPATFFGKPTWGTALWSRGEEIKVKG